MNPRRALMAAVVITVAAVVAAVVAVSSSTSATVAMATGGNGSSVVLAADKAQAAPELQGISAFDNTAPTTLAAMRGKVVLVDFWTYTCINCRRTFPFLHGLTDTYGSAGLTVLGVHSPEFGFEKKHSNVARAVKELGVTWPVAEDPEMDTWSAFGNQYWPADYLIDRNGLVRYAHFGEGDDDQIEAAVRTLLAEGGTVPAAHVGDVKSAGDPGDANSQLTPETYFGAERGGEYAAGGKTVPAGATQTRRDRAQNASVVQLDGSFTGAAESLQLNAGAEVTDRVRARDAYVTAAAAHGPVTLEVTLDGKPVPAARRGSSLEVEHGRTVVVIGSQDLYHLLTGPAVASGALELTARTAGAQLFTFTFGA